jgi:hypothetical protein
MVLGFRRGADSEDPGTLYIAAGIGGGPNNDPVQSHGLFASIQFAPSFQITGIQNGASFIAGPIAPNTWISIKGNGLSATTGEWQVTGNTLPTIVNGVGVTVNGTLAPALFTLGSNATSGNTYVAAQHADGTLIGPAATIKGATPAEPGETIVLYATVFGPTLASAGALEVKPTIVLDGIAADLTFAGMVGPGLYQFNVVVPSTVTLGQDVLVVGLSGNFETRFNAFLTITAQ